jgi:hypothetical protein
MKNETKTGLTSGAKLTIPGCDFWGEYDGYKVFRCYSKDVPTSTYPNIVFAIGNKLFMNGGCIGRVDDAGRVSNWAPTKWVKKEEPKVNKPAGRPVEFDTTTFKADIASSKSAEEILNGSWKRSVEDLVGEKFSAEYKYSE